MEGSKLRNVILRQYNDNWFPGSWKKKWFYCALTTENWMSVLVISVWNPQVETLDDRVYVFTCARLLFHSGIILIFRFKRTNQFLSLCLRPVQVNKSNAETVHTLRIKNDSRLFFKIIFTIILNEISWDTRNTVFKCHGHGILSKWWVILSSLPFNIII